MVESAHSVSPSHRSTGGQSPEASLAFSPSLSPDPVYQLPSSFEVEINSDGDEVLPKTKLRSTWWDHFQRVKTNDGSIKAKCLYCKKKLVGNVKSGTTHLKDHYNSCTKRKLVVSGQKLPSPSFMMREGKMELGAYTFNQEFAQQQLAGMVAVHEYPISIVDHVWFRRFSHALQPLFHMVSRNTLKEDIFRIYDVEKVKTIKLLEMNKSRISLTTDMRSSPNEQRGFMVITAHFIDDSWTLQSRVLRFVYLPCPHTAEMLCKVMIDTYFDWNIDGKLSTLTVDNATTNDAMISLLLEKFSSSCYMWHKSLFHVRCAAHTLNLIVRDGLDKIKDSIEKIRGSVAFWTSTTRRRKKFAEAVHFQQLSINYGKKLALDCVTRWNSTFLMLETAIAYKEVFDRLKHWDKAFKCCPDSSDWELATEICKRLEIFYKVTKLFSGTKYPTSNLFFANMCTIKIELAKWTNCEIEVVQTMAIPMQEKYEKYWQNIHGILGIAAVLDPRYKMDLIEYYFRKIYGLNASCNVESIRSLCYDLLTVYEGKAKDKSSSSKAPSMPSTLEEDDVLSDFDSFVPENKKGKSAHVKSELDYYLEEERLPRKGEFDILAWWKSNGLKFPTLQAIARDVLAVPVSSVASESSFSTSGRILRPNRSRLHPKTLEALMCTQSWLVAQETGGVPMMPANHVGDVDDVVEEEDDLMFDITSLSDCD